LQIKSILLGILATSSLALAEDLTLPMADPSGGFSAPTEALQPTVIIKPPPLPGAAIAPAPEAMPDDARELALLEMERQIIENQVRFEIAHAHRTGNSTELKRVIIVNGPMDAAMSRAAKAPTATENKVALIGLPDSVAVSKNLEQFFGVPMTPDREKELLQTVKTQLAGISKNAGMDVRIAGWWPAEGVMAVSVMPNKG